MRNSSFDYTTVERPSTTTSVGLSSFFVDFRLRDGRTNVQRPPTTASVGLAQARPNNVNIKKGEIMQIIQVATQSTHFQSSSSLMIDSPGETTFYISHMKPLSFHHQKGGK